MSCQDASQAPDAWRGTVRNFCWMGPGAIPEQLDLRRCGWEIATCGDQPTDECIGVFHVAGLDSAEWMDTLSSIPYEARRHVLITGVELALERSALLQIGFGDAVSQEISIDELAARASRVAETLRWLPRHREIGALMLDLLAREAFGFDKPLNLNPREFALLWRLADTPDQTVSKQLLIQDVWRMGFVPETNSIAVHMSRLRRKLSFVGLAGMIETSSPGGYRLRAPDRRHDRRRALPVIA